MPGAGMATPVILLPRSFRSVTCFGRTLHMKGVLAVVADKGFFRLVSFLELVGHFMLLYAGSIVFVVLAGV